MSLVFIGRHPVKAMGGERLDRVQVDRRGLVGDRRLAVIDADGKFATGKNTTRFRRHDEVFDYAATLSADEVLVSGNGGHWRAGDPALDAELSERMGIAVGIREEQETPFYDSSPVSIIGTASLEWCRERLLVDADPRRLRVNFVVETEEPFIEDTWLGRDLVIGELRVHVTKQITRCRMIDIAQNHVSTTTPWLKSLQPRAARLAVYAQVVAPAWVSVGNQVRPPRV